MILADTSIWVEHFSSPNAILDEMLNTNRIGIHPYVIGELALGNLRKRAATLQSLRTLPIVLVAEPEEVLAFIEQHTLYSQGIGYVDTHLLAAAALTPDTSLWTLDKRLAVIARKLGLAAKPHH